MIQNYSNLEASESFKAVRALIHKPTQEIAAVAALNNIKNQLGKIVKNTCAI
jgi:hypothetical protein